MIYNICANLVVVISKCFGQLVHITDHFFVSKCRLQAKKPSYFGSVALTAVEHPVLELDEAEEGGGEGFEHPRHGGVQLVGGQREQVGLNTQLWQILEHLGQAFIGVCPDHH